MERETSPTWKGSLSISNNHANGATVNGSFKKERGFISSSSKVKDNEDWKIARNSNITNDLLSIDFYFVPCNSMGEQRDGMSWIFTAPVKSFEQAINQGSPKFSVEGIYKSADKAIMNDNNPLFDVTKSFSGTWKFNFQRVEESQVNNNNNNKNNNNQQ
jgi:hypothetical protein